MILGGSHDRRVELAESIVYLCALIADQPRSIDRHIDYFGETRSLVLAAQRYGSHDRMLPARRAPDSSARPA